MEIKHQLAVDYWFNMLKDDGFTSSLAVENNKGMRRSLSFSLSQETAAKLQKAGNRQPVSLCVLAMSAWMVLLKRYGISAPFIVTPSLQQAGTGNLYFRINDVASFREATGDLTAQLKIAVKHQGHSHTHLMEMLEANGVEITGHQYLPGFVFEELHGTSFEHNGLWLVVNEEGACTLHYNESMLPAQVIANIPVHWEQLFTGLLAAPDQDIGNLNFLPEKEIEHLLHAAGNEPVVAADDLLHYCVAQAAGSNPGAVAVAGEDISFTYAELEERSNRLAAYLLQKARVKSGQVVGLMMEHEPWAIVAIMAILKAGCAYLPVDPQYPDERTRLMLDQSGAVFMIGCRELPGTCIPVLPAKEIPFIIAEQPTGVIAVDTQPDDVAYIIFTSGSTGVPKGVPVTHRQACHLIKTLTQVFGFEPGLTFVINASFSFDASVKEIFLPLFTGGTLRVFAGFRNISEFVPYLCRSGVEVMHASPLFWQEVINMLEENNDHASLRYISSGGDVLSPNLAQRIRKQFPGALFLNLYGPTETCINATYHIVPQEAISIMPIGKALPGYRAFVLDEQGNLLPAGIAGELCIAGTGVTNGYIGNEEATKKAFVRCTVNNNETIYRTGDKVRWNAAGELEFLGRLDSQLKIRGYRIEPDEIRLVLESDALVEKAYITTYREEDDSVTLVAYVLSSACIEEIRASLAEKVPAYMVPGKWIPVEKFYKNNSGKIDVTRLPKPGEYYDGLYEPAATATEAKLISIWQSLFPKKRFGALDNFFNRGGHSLNALRLLTGIIKEMHVQPGLKDIFKYPVLRDMAAHLDRIAGNEIEAITIAPAAAQYPLSPAQQRLWILHQLEEGKAPYNISAGFIISGTLDEQALQRALHYITSRYEILRTIFTGEGSEPGMIILPENNFQPVIHRTALQHEAAAPDAARLLAKAEAVRPFDLTTAPPWRLHLYYLGAGETAGVFIFHHIISDGWSMDVFTRILLQAYKNIVLDSEPGLPALPVQYKDYASWMRSSGRLQQARAFWLNKFSDEVHTTDVPADHPRPAIRNHNGSAIYMPVNGRLAEKLNQFCRKHNVTAFVVWFAAFRNLLYRYTGQTDSIVGIPVAGRDVPGLEEQIGFFVNTLPVRVAFDGTESFAGFVQRVKEELLQHYQHQHYPFDRLIDELNIPRDTSRSPLFDILFGALPAPGFLQDNDLPGASIRPFTIDTTTSKYDILINILENASGYTIYTEFDTALFGKERITRMMEHFLQLLDNAISDPDEVQDALRLTDHEEEQGIVNGFNANRSVYPAYASLYEIFCEKASAFPAHVAIREENGDWSYARVSKMVDRLAKALIMKGIQPGQPVALLMERTVWLPISVLAIHKAGAYYVPVDVSLPSERIRYMLKDTGTSLLLSNIQQAGQWPGMPHLHVYDPGWLANENVEETEIIFPAGSGVAYMIYTSGSTGMPKGVLVEHSQAMNTLFAMQETCPVRREDVYLFKTNYAFDVSVAELFGWFMGGGSMVVLPAGDEKDPQAIFDAIKKYSVTHINFVPSLFALFFGLLKENAEATAQLRYIFIAGEAFPAALAADVCRSGWASRVYNLYGPTEASIYATGCSLEQHDVTGPVYIGRPLQNVEIYILGAGNTIVPVGIPGELCIGGPGVSSGYHANEQLTAERFIGNPFGAGKIYRSGDIARWTADGQIEYIGRVDEQVKLRGYRIEIGEIEYILGQVEGVQQCIVVVKEQTPGNKQLVAYITATGAFNKEEAMNKLRSALPVYMVPAVIVQLDALPLNKSGKVNRKALPEPGWQAHSSQTFVAPEGYVQETVAGIWKQVLAVQEPGIHDNFFSAGGNSLLAIRLTAAICKVFKVTMPVKEVFLHPDIAGLSAVIASGKFPSNIPAIVPVKEKEQLPLSFAQERFWMIDKWGISQAYHIPVVLRLSGALNIPALQKAFTALIDRHEPLRTVIKENRGVPHQEITRVTEFDLPCYGHIAGEEQYGKMIGDFIYRPFDLAADIPVRACLIKKNDHTHTLALVFHHIALDIWSVYLIAHELEQLYKAFCTQQEPTLPPMAIRYADYAVWQRSYLSGNTLERKAGYWVNKLQGHTTVQLPEDHARPAVRQFTGRTMRTVIGSDVTVQLKQMADSCNTTLFVTLLAAFKVVLHRYSGQNDIGVGVPVANRAQQEVEQLAGCFINTIVLRSNIEPGMPFTTLLQQLNETAMEGYGHQDVPFEYLVEKLDAGRNPLFNIMFELQDMHLATGLALHDLQIEEEPYEHSTALFDLSVSISRDAQKNELLLDMEYSTELFNEDTIAQIGAHYTSLLHTIAQRRDEPVGTLPLMNAEETGKILDIFSGVAKEYPKNITVLDLFKQQVQLNPSAKAIVFNETLLSYKELDEQSTQLARYLIGMGVTAGSFVAIFMDRSLPLVTAILGVLKAGAAYIPIDPAYPEARVLHMINDANTSVIITDDACAADLENSGRILVNLDADRAAIEQASPVECPVVAPYQLAYVIYTSGSTGLPKGVMISHENLLNIVLNWRDHYHLDTMKPVLFSIASIAFDVFTGDWCRTLTNGGTMVIADNRNFDMQDFYTAMQQNGVNIMESTPSVIMSFTRYMENAQLDFSFMKLLIIGSDVLAAESYTWLREKYGNCMRIINSYGVTEAAIDSSYFEGAITHAGITPIGRPLNNLYYYILDEYMNPVPVNVWGELYIGGAGVAKGYLNRKELNAERFLENPFMPGTTFYKTGDRSRWLKDGCVQFAGRSDEQVKIRGFRIEPGEIQNVLLQHEAVSNAVIVVQHDPLNPADKYLCAFYTIAAGDEEPGTETLRSFLLERLPVFMIPDYFLRLPHIPLTVNNKVDKQALPFAKEHASPSVMQAEPPEGEIETSLFALWAEVLKTERFGVTDNFFFIGGHSLKAVNLLSLINETFMTDIKMKEFIADPVIRSLAAIITSFYEEQKYLFAEALDETIGSGTV